LDRIPALLKRFRQSVLAAACSGKLTAHWREENELESGIVDHAETGSRVPSNWKSDFLGNVARFIDYRGRTPQKVDAGIPLITAKNIRPGYIDREPREFIKSEEYERWMTRGIPRIGDVLVTTEAPLGYAASVDLEGRFALAQRVICLQFSEPRNQEFALLYIMSPMFQAMLIEQATGTTVSGIKASRLKQLTMLIPPLSEQYEIVRRVEQLFAFADQIEARLTKSQAQVDRLTQSILAKAFRGELVPTEAELARREGRDYEPASKLLERIQSERERTTPSRPKIAKRKTAQRSKQP
jgi:type I restriction enzyme S subunit